MKIVPAERALGLPADQKIGRDLFFAALTDFHGFKNTVIARCLSSTFHDSADHVKLASSFKREIPVWI